MRKNVCHGLSKEAHTLVTLCQVNVHLRNERVYESSKNASMTCCPQECTHTQVLFTLRPGAMSARRGYTQSAGTQRLQQAAAARRAEAAAIKADPYWIRHLNRNQVLNCQIFAYANRDGQMTDNGHDSKLMPDVLAMCNPENDELLNRPAFGVSEKAGTAWHALDQLQKHLEKRTTLVNKELFVTRLAPFFELLPSLQVLDGSRPQSRSADIVSALQHVVAEGCRVKGDARAQMLLQNMKFIGLQMYEAAFALETLLGFLGNPALFREKLGHVERQDPKVQQWPMSHGADAARMINFLKASIMRRYGVDAKRKTKPAASSGDIGSLDSDAEVLATDGQSAGEDDLGLSEHDLEPEDPLLPSQTVTESQRPGAKAAAKTAPVKRRAADPEVADLKAQMATMMSMLMALTERDRDGPSAGVPASSQGKRASERNLLDDPTSESEMSAAPPPRKKKVHDALESTEELQQTAGKKKKPDEADEPAGKKNKKPRKGS